MFGKSNRFDYFKAFSRQAEFACEESALLVKILENFDPEKLRDQIDEAHTIEHSADQINHEIFKNLVTEFVAPIEREDISELGADLDNIIDYIEDVVQRLYMHNVQSVPEEALELARTIELACKELRAALEDLPSFKRSHDIREHIIEVNNLEEKGDVIYFRGVHRLYTQVEDPIIVLAWDNIFAKLEKCCDACEHVADVTKNIVMKNS